MPQNSQPTKISPTLNRTLELMLILSRKLGESIVIDGRVSVSVVRMEKDVVKIGIDAPREMPIYRKELYDEIASSNTSASVEHVDCEESIIEKVTI